MPAIKARNREHLRSLVNTGVTSPLSTKLTKIQNSETCDFCYDNSFDHPTSPKFLNFALIPHSTLQNQSKIAIDLL